MIAITSSLPLEKIDFQKFPDGVIPAVVQDCSNLDILDIKFVNKGAIQKMLETKQGYYYSPERKTIEKYGMKHGNTHRIVDIRINESCNALLIRVYQKMSLGYYQVETSFKQQLEEARQLRKI